MVGRKSSSPGPVTSSSTPWLSAWVNNDPGTSIQLRSAARALGLQLHVLHASTERDFETMFASLQQLQVGALVIASDPFLNSHSEQLAALALRYTMPTMHQYREFPAAGGLMGYGGSITDSYSAARSSRCLAARWRGRLRLGRSSR